MVVTIHLLYALVMYPEYLVQMYTVYTVNKLYEEVLYMCYHKRYNVMPIRN